MSENLNETPEPLMPPVTQSGQRIVLLHTKGPFAGLHQITGHSEEFDGQAPPSVTPEFTITPGKRKGVAGLVKSTTRFLLYKEIDTPLTKGFDREQR